MSTSKSTACSHSNPIEFPQTETDEQADEQTEQTEQSEQTEQPEHTDQLETEQLSSADNEMQLEFLEFLKSLDETPQVIDNEDEQVELQRELELSMTQTEADAPSDEQLSGQLELELVLEQPQQQQQTLLQHNFIHKLYLAASSQQVSFINWSADGQQLQLDYIELHEYLSGEQLIFASHSVLQFTRQLLELGFERVMQDSELEEAPQLYFQHAHFKPGQREQLLLLTKQRSSVASKHQAGSSQLQQARCRFETVLSFHNDERLLQEQEPSADQLLPRRGRASSRQTTQPLQPALAVKHLNPRDSVLLFEAGHVPEYAGFYGRVKQTLVNEFFAEYLPRYGNRTCGYKDIIVDASRTNAFQQNLPIGMVYSEDEEDFDELDHQENISAELSIKVEHGQPPTEDIELEQVMQELCGVAFEGNDEDLAKKELTLPKSKAKRKKLAKKCAITDTDMEPEETEHAFLQPAVAAPSHMKVNRSSSNESQSNLDEVLHSPANSKNVLKRRRYDLRNSKTKRTR